MPSQVEKAIAKFRDEMLARDERAVRQVLEGYVSTRIRLTTRIDELVAVRAERGSLTTSQVLRMERARELLSLIDAELTQLARDTLKPIEAGQKSAVEMAVNHAQQLTIESVNDAARVTMIEATWTRIITPKMEAMIGRIQEGVPLDRWLAKFGSEVARRMERTLVDAVALGTNPRGIAARLARELDIGAARLLTTTRTAQLNAYRDAILANYQVNEEMLDGWIWTCAKQSRTCLACLSLDGSVFPLSVEFMPTHPNCRCIPRPKINGESDSGVEVGKEWFDRQSEETRRSMIPKSAYDDYAAKRLHLDDFRYLRNDEVWGDSYIQASVQQARISANVRRGRERRTVA